MVAHRQPRDRLHARAGAVSLDRVRARVRGEPRGCEIRVARHRARHGVPRLESGSPGLRAHDPPARARADPGSRQHAVRRRRRIPPVSAAHQAGEHRDGRRLQRRPALDDCFDGRLHQGDRRLVGARRRRPVRMRCEPDGVRVRTPEEKLPSRGREPRPSRSAAHWAGGLERLPQSQLLLEGAGRVVPDLRKQGRPRRRIGAHCGHVLLHRPRVRGDLPTARARRRSDGSRRTYRADARRRYGTRVGRRVVPARLRRRRRQGGKSGVRRGRGSRGPPPGATSP
jgi:hypothetical protein